MDARPHQVDFDPRVTKIISVLTTMDSKINDLNKKIMQLQSVVSDLSMTVNSEHIFEEMKGSYASQYQDKKGIKSSKKNMDDVLASMLKDSPKKYAPNGMASHGRLATFDESDGLSDRFNEDMMERAFGDVRLGAYSRKM